MHFDLDKLDPLTSIAPIKTAADLEWNSWMRELGEQRVRDSVTRVWVMTERMRSYWRRYTHIPEAAEQRDAAGAMDEALRELHTPPKDWARDGDVYYGKRLARRFPDNTMKRTQLIISTPCKEDSRLMDWYAERSTPQRELLFAGVDADWRWIAEHPWQWEDAPQRELPGGVDVGRPGGDMTAVAVVGHSAGGERVLSVMNVVPGVQARWVPPIDFPADTVLEFRRLPRDCPTCKHNDDDPTDEPCWSCSEQNGLRNWEPKT